LQRESGEYLHLAALAGRAMNSFSDPNYRAALKAFGERGIVDLIGVSGYYTLVSMMLNVDRHPLPAGAEPPLKKIG